MLDSQSSPPPSLLSLKARHSIVTSLTFLSNEHYMLLLILVLLILKLLCSLSLILCIKGTAGPPRLDYLVRTIKFCHLALPGKTLENRLIYSESSDSCSLRQVAVLSCYTLPRRSTVSVPLVLQTLPCMRKGSLVKQMEAIFSGHSLLSPISTDSRNAE